MRIGVEGHARAGVAKDAVDLDDIEADVDDQVAGKGVAEIVEAQPPIVAIETGVDGRPTQHSFRDVVVQERGATRGCEDVIGAAGKTRAVFVLPEDRGELGEERDLADGAAYVA